MDEDICGDCQTDAETYDDLCQSCQQEHDEQLGG